MVFSVTRISKHDMNEIKNIDYINSRMYGIRLQGDIEREEA